MKPLLLIALAIFLSGCGDVWNGVYYPEGVGFVDESKWEYSSLFSTKEECIDWCMQKRSNSPNAQCECGRNCKPDGYGGQLCKETIGAY